MTVTFDPINVGVTPNDDKGDSARAAWTKQNRMTAGLIADVAAASGAAANKLDVNGSGALLTGVAKPADLTGKLDKTGDASGASAAPTGGVSRYFRDSAADNINVLWFGAVADLVVDANNNYVSGTDNTAAFQAAINRAISLRRDVCVPGGSYYLASGITADLSATTLDTGSRPSIRGVGRGTTWLRFGLGSFSAITYKGGATGAGPHIYATISGLRIDKVDVKGIGLDFRVAAFMSIEDVMVLGFDTGISGVDMLSSRFRHVTSTFNRIGANFVRGSFSHPNALSFIDCNLSNNNETGLVAASPTTLSVLGGEIAGNGLNSTSATRGGIYINGNPLEGGVGLVSDHVYYEYNMGLADVLIATGAATGTHTFRANTFNRTNGTNYVTNMIRVTGSASTMLDVRGNAFKRFNDYSASASRPYIDTSGAANASLDFSSTNLMDDPTTEGAPLSEWKSWTPTISTFSGTITAYTVNSARFRKQGKTVSLNLDITITTNGSGAGDFRFTPPIAAGSGTTPPVQGQLLSTGEALVGSWFGPGFGLKKYNGSYPGGDGYRLSVSSTYEIN
jgi:hypothetical protein